MPRPAQETRATLDGRTIELVRSPRRKRTVSAEERGDVIRILLPARMSKAEEDRWVAEMVDRLTKRKRRQPKTDEALAERAARLAARYELPEPSGIRWAPNQRSRWGSCTISDRSIRISTALKGLPEWVIDYVIVHELAHLIEPSHSPRFWKVVNRFPKAERARGFLMAKELDAGD